jgi:hypothetical protein
VIQPPSTVAVEQAVLVAPPIVSTLAVRIVPALSVWYAVTSGVTTPPQAMARAARLEAVKYGFDEMMAEVMDPDTFDFRDMIALSSKLRAAAVLDEPRGSRCFFERANANFGYREMPRVTERS